MKLEVFKLEKYLEEREFTTEVVFGASDMASFSMNEILGLADVECRTLWDDLSLQYTQPKGHPLLVEEIRKGYAKEVGVLCIAGAQEGIFATCNTLLDKDDHVIVITPCYQSLKEIPKAICGTTDVELDSDGGKWSLNLDRVRKAVRKNTKLIVVNFPHNPTGFLLSVSEQKELVQIARDAGAYLFSDEVYAELTHDKAKAIPPIASEYEKGISLGVMSKSYGMPGARIGWLASKDQALLRAVEDYKYYLSICNSAPAEILTLIALRNREKLLARNHELMMKNLKLVREFFQTRPETFRWYEPSGGCIAFVELLRKESAYDFAESLREKEGVLVLPGSVFDYSKKFFRVGYGRNSVEEALKRLKRFLDGVN